MSCCTYLELSDCRRIPMFREGKSKNQQILAKPIFCKQFIQLWELLYDVGVGDLPTYTGIIYSFPLPDKPISRLIGFPTIVDSSSIFRVYSFINDDVSGPIINHGYSLQSYNDEVFYEIKWKIEEDLDNFVIGFYRSDGFVNEITNTFSLICGSHGASIFRTSCGKMISPGISNLFVAANKNTKIKLKIKVIIPDKLLYPRITMYNPYTKYITIQDSNCMSIQLPVYKMFAFGETSIVKEPSKYFVEATTIIKNYLRRTGLPIRLLPDGKLPKSLYSFLNNHNSSIIDTIEFNPIPKNGVGSITTKPLTICDSDYFVDGLPRGIKLSTPINKVAKITFRISTNSTNLECYDLEYRVQYKSGTCFYTHNKLNENGLIESTAESLVNIKPGLERPIIGIYKLPQTAVAFAITIYFNVTANVDLITKENTINTLVKNTVFDYIKIEYVDLID